MGRDGARTEGMVKVHKKVSYLCLMMWEKGNLLSLGKVECLFARFWEMRGGQMVGSGESG